MKVYIAAYSRDPSDPTNGPDVVAAASEEALLAKVKALPHQLSSRSRIADAESVDEINELLEQESDGCYPPFVYTYTEEV